MDASVKTLVVSWKEAADIKLFVSKEAFVIPSNKGSVSISKPPRLLKFKFSWRIKPLSTLSPQKKLESPGFITLTFLNIWDTITSKCLSLINTD
jgi:hypothetical protein